MPRQRRKPCKSGRTAYIASKSYCGNDEFGVQTDVSLSHTARDELWTASCSDPVADFKGECEGVVSEAPTNSLGVLDLDCVKVVLIVDDAALNRKMLWKLLIQKGIIYYKYLYKAISIIF